MRIEDIFFNYLNERIATPYILRYPFQESAVDFKNGFVSWRLITSQPLSSQSYENKKERNGVLKTVTSQRFIDSYLFYCEKEYNKDNNLTPNEVISSISMLLNSYEFIHYTKEIEVLRIINNVTDDTYFNATNKWINKSSLQIDFITKRELANLNYSIDALEYNINTI